MAAERRSSIAALVLAAGGSSRFGEPKQLIDWGGRTLLEHVLEMVGQWPVDHVYLVLGDREEEILDAIDLPPDVVVVVNPAWEEGIASSLRVGLDALIRDRAADAVFVVLGDQPSIPAEVPGALIEARLRSGLPAIVPEYRYATANPALLDRSLWPTLMSLTGDKGAAGLLALHPEWVEKVHFDTLPPRDVDTPNDAEALRPRR